MLLFTDCCAMCLVEGPTSCQWLTTVKDIVYSVFKSVYDAQNWDTYIETKHKKLVTHYYGIIYLRNFSNNGTILPQIARFWGKHTKVCQ